MDSNFQAILIECIFDILQPLLTDAIQEHECGPTDGTPVVQCWGRYFLKVTSYLLLVTFSESNSLQLHITSTKK